MTYNLDISTGFKCNFRCSYCFEQKYDQAYTDVEPDDKVINRTIEYIDYLKKKIFTPDDIISLTFYGGEPLLNLDLIEKIAIVHGSDRVKYSIASNGYLVKEKLDQILRINELSNNKLIFGFSYDFFLQDKNRKANTYQKIRDNIKLLYKLKIRIIVVACIPYGDLKYFDKVFFDVLELKRQFPRIDVVFNVDRSKTSKTDFNEEECVEGLTKVKDFLDTYGKNDILTYNNACGTMDIRDTKCVYGHIYGGIDPYGNIYPANNLIFYPKEYVKKCMYLGNIFEDFDVLTEKRTQLISSLNFNRPYECSVCEAPCRVFPWSTIKTDISEFNQMPSEEQCRVHKFLHKYLG